MLGGVNKDDIEAYGGSGFVRPFANEYEDYSGDGIEDDEGDVESEDQPMEEYDDEDYYQGVGIGEKARRRGGIAKKENRVFKDYDDEDYQSRGVGEDGRTIKGDDVLHGQIGHAKGTNERRGGAGNRVNEHHEAGNDILFEETHKQEEHQGWSKKMHNIGVEDKKNRGKAIKNEDPSEEAAGQWKSARRSNEEGEREDPSEEGSGWSAGQWRSNEEREGEDMSEEASGLSAEIFGGTAILFAMLLLLILTFLICKWR